MVGRTATEVRTLRKNFGKFSCFSINVSTVLATRLSYLDTSISFSCCNNPTPIALVCNSCLAGKTEGESTASNGRLSAGNGGETSDRVLMESRVEGIGRGEVISVVSGVQVG